MIAEIKDEVERRGITRLCHLTPSRNLVHIATGDGLLSTKQLQARERKAFNQQDLDRLDLHPDHICCSIEYPNAWYLRQRQRDSQGEKLLFPDWVCLCIDPRWLWADTTLFSPRNAAAGRGSYVAGGADAFRGLFSQSVCGAHGVIFPRSAQRPDACPTDEQAEVLVYRRVPLEDVQQIVVATESHAKRVYNGLLQLGVSSDAFRYSICEEFFLPGSLTDLLRSGRRPIERRWDPGESADG